MILKELWGFCFYPRTKLGQIIMTNISMDREIYLDCISILEIDLQIIKNLLDDYHHNSEQIHVIIQSLDEIIEKLPNKDNLPQLYSNDNIIILENEKGTSSVDYKGGVAGIIKNTLKKAKKVKKIISKKIASIDQSDVNDIPGLLHLDFENIELNFFCEHKYIISFFASYYNGNQPLDKDSWIKIKTKFHKNVLINGTPMNKTTITKKFDGLISEYEFKDRFGPKKLELSKEIFKKFLKMVP